MSRHPLQCPVCGEENLVSLQQLAIRGRALEPDVVCAHCNTDLYLQHRQQDPNSPPEWELVIAEHLKQDERRAFQEILKPGKTVH